MKFDLTAAMNAIAMDPGMPTRDKVSKLRKAAPGLKGIDMARLLGVSRERVRQILVDLGLNTRVPGEHRGGARPRRKKGLLRPVVRRGRKTKAKAKAKTKPKRRRRIPALPPLRRHQIEHLGQ